MPSVAYPAMPPVAQPENPMKFTILTTVLGLSMWGAAFAHEGAPKMDMMKMADSNNDGKISLAEHNAYAAKMFNMMDADKDGSVTAAEMEAGHKMMMRDDKMKHDKMMKNGKMMDHDKMMKDGTEKKPASRP